MKTKLVYIIFLLLAAVQGAEAQQENILLLPSLQSGAGREASITVQMNNTAEIVAVQFEMQFPRGFRLSDTTTLQVSDRKSNHTVSAKYLGNFQYLFVIFSTSNQLLMGNSGDLVRIPVVVPDTCTAGIQHAFSFRNIIITGKSGENVATGSQGGALEVIISPRPDVQVQNITIAGTSVSPGEKVVVSWQVANTGDLGTSGGWSEQVSLVSSTGESAHLGTTYYSEWLQPTEGVLRQAEFSLNSYPGVDGPVQARVKLIPNKTLGELPAAASNNTGLSTGTILINKLLTLKQNRTHIPENDQGYVQYQVLRSGSRSPREAFAITTDKPGRIQLPDSVVLTPGNSGAVFYGRPIDNDQMNMDSVVTVSVAGNNYDQENSQVIIVDNEVPGLTLTATAQEMTEGDSIVLTVSRQLVTSQALIVNLQTNYPKRFTFAKEVTIAANQKTAQITVKAIEDKLPDLNVAAYFTASGQSYSTTRYDLILNDNDVPQLQLTIGPDTVSESAGFQAAMGIIKRTGATDQNVYVRLSDNSSGMLYYNTPTVTLLKGQTEARFTIGVVDNTLMEGDKGIDITAAVFITQCNCTVAPESAGTVKGRLMVSDDDGPALKVVSSQSMLPEGKAAATVLTVSRNTPPVADLAVSLSSNLDSRLVYTHNIVILAGQTSATVSVDVLGNSVPEGDQMVSFTATSDGYSNGFCWAMISDQTLADAQLAIELLSTDTIETKGTLRIRMRVTNSGSAVLTQGKDVDVFITASDRPGASRTKLGSILTRAGINPGSSDTLSLSVTLPDMTGLRYLLAEININQQQKELSFLNNVSPAAPLVMNPAYQVSMSTDKTSYQTTDTIVFTGKASNGAGQGISNALVEIYLVAPGGQRTTFNATTDAEGNYWYKHVPTLSTLGRFNAGACYPGEGLTGGLKTIDILGLKRSSSAYIIWEVLTNEEYTGEIDIMNPGATPLTSIVTSVETSVPGLLLSFDPIASIAAGASAKLKYRLTATQASTKNDYDRIKLVSRSSEGASLEMTGYYVSQNPRATLKAGVSSINTTMTKGAVRTYDLLVTNTGKGESGPITLSLPQTTWMSLVSASTLPSLKSGESTTIVFQFAPGSDLSLNVPVNGSIGVNCQNGTGFALPFRIEPVSESTGNLVIDACDEYTYYTDEAPHVAGAQVRIRHPYTKALITEGKTNESGLFTIEGLPEGYYFVEVTADRHDSYSNNIMIDPGKTNTLVVNLSFQAITYTWEVVETEVEDVYELETIVKFETNVPTPVIEMISPKEIDTEKLSIGESLVFNVILTNKGLITAKDVEVVVPRGMSSLTFEPLFNMIELKPRESVMIPVTVTKIGSPSGAPQRAMAAADNCKEYIAVIYLWDCGLDRKWHQFTKEISLGTWCFSKSNPTPPSNWSGYSLTFGGWGGGWGGYGGSSSQTTPTVSVADCEPCQNSFLYKMAKCFITRIPIVEKVLTVVETAICTAEVVVNGDLTCVAEKIITSEKWISTIIGFQDLYEDCLKPILEPCVPGSFVRHSPDGSARTTQEMPAFIAHFQEVMQYVYDMSNSYQAQLQEIFGDSVWLKQTGGELNIFWSQLTQYTGIIADDAPLKQFRPGGITEAQYLEFIHRWNNSLNPAYSGTNRINFNTINQLTAIQEAAKAYAKSLGYNSVREMFDKEYAIYEQEANDNSGSVCATITLKFSQTMTMTRQAFRGTLTVFNGHETVAMKEVELDLIIKDAGGIIATSHEFQVNTEKLVQVNAIDGTGIINPKDTAIASILFIPTKYAAPSSPQEYSFGGTLGYLDPFTGTKVTRDLYPVTLTVKPSPDLVLNYFMQRDVIGDDPLTTEVVEPSEDAEFTLLIFNEGAGDATNVRISSKQPEIIDNEKGLLIDFEIVSSSLNGAEKNIGITNIDFGTIPTGSSAYGQWWFRSSLLGHFVEYDTKITHVTSYDNPDLSLVKSLNIHELIRSIEVTRNNTKLRGFMANDVVDTYDYPDRMYLSDGSSAEISTLNTVEVVDAGTNQKRLSITPTQAGWNYAVIADPYNGRSQLTEVKREADNVMLPLANFRQTALTLRDGKDPIHENKLHFIDEVALAGGNYLLTFEPKRDNILKVTGFGSVPVAISQNQINQVEVVFNRAILDSTFTHDDISLSCQGINLDVSKVTISRLNALTYRLHLDSVTHTNGYFYLTVQTNGIKDEEGYAGELGLSTNWTQFLDGAVQVSVQIIPENSGTVSPQTGAYNYGVPVNFKATPKTGYLFKHWSMDNVILSAENSLSHIPLETKLIQAHFELKKYLVVTACDSTMGQLTGHVTGIYVHGNTLYFVALAREGFEFTGWKINGTFSASKETNLAVELMNDIAIEPVFRKKDGATVLIEIPTGKLMAYPNPARKGDEVTLVLPIDETQLRNTRIRLISLTGSIVYDEVPVQKVFKWKGLSAGMYVIQLVTPNQQYQLQKLLVK